MRILAGASLVALLCAAPAGAQTTVTPPSAPATMAPPSVPAPPSHCGTINPAPQLPHGADATAAQMQTANDAFTAWATDTHTKLECRREETRVLMAQATAAHDDFNNSVTQMNDVTTSWQAEVAAYNTRHGHAPAGHQPEERLHR